MPTLELPHTAGCLVCGRDNPHGLHLSLFVDPDTGIVTTCAIPQSHHIGFEGVVHGGWIATVADEAMVWTAIWSSRRSCLAAELTVRFKHKAVIDQPLQVIARIEKANRRLIETTCQFATTDGIVIATAGAKYMPLSPEVTGGFFETLVDDPATRDSANLLKSDQKGAEGISSAAPVAVLEYQPMLSDQHFEAIARFSAEFHANLALLCLEGEGIHATIQGATGMFGAASADLHLLVPAIEAARAREILSHTPAQAFLLVG